MTAPNVARIIIVIIDGENEVVDEADEVDIVAIVETIAPVTAALELTQDKLQDDETKQENQHQEQVLKGEVIDHFKK